MNDATSATTQFSLEKSLLHSSDLLRYLAAIADETGESLSGSQRDRVFSMRYLIERLKGEVVVGAGLLAIECEALAKA